MPYDPLPSVPRAHSRDIPIILWSAKELWLLSRKNQRPDPCVLKRVRINQFRFSQTISRCLASFCILFADGEMGQGKSQALCTYSSIWSSLIISSFSSAFLGDRIHRPGKAVKFKAVFFIKPGITSEDLIGNIHL